MLTFHHVQSTSHAYETINYHHYLHIHTPLFIKSSQEISHQLHKFSPFSFLHHKFKVQSNCTTLHELHESSHITSIVSMATQEEETRKMASSFYPLDPNSYKLIQKIGIGVSATVYKAACLPMNSTVVAIKAIDLERSRANLDDARREAKSMALLSHPNILKAHCSFTVDHHLWVVMPFISAGSLHSIISSSFPDGLNESAIAVVLKETLNALWYLHDQGHLHRDIKAGNILVDSDGSVKLADFGVSTSIYEPNPSHFSSSSSNLRFNDLAGTPYWMAPEVIHSHVGYSFKADIWSFGITALELAHGRPPLSHLPAWKTLFMRIANRFVLSDFEKSKNKKFSKRFRDMVASCLATDPSTRPTAEKLLKHPFFKNIRSVDFLVKNLLQGLPTVEERYRESLWCRCAPHTTTNDVDDDDNEEAVTSPIEKRRRISGWNFNEEVFELDPVFPNGSVCNPFKSPKEGKVRRVSFIEERKTENEDFQMNQNQMNVDEEAEKDEVVNGGMVATAPLVEGGIHKAEHYEMNPSNPKAEVGMVPTAPLVPKLRALMESLEDERQMVSNLISRIGGGDIEISYDEHLQQTIVELSFQLEQERRKSSNLEKELDILKRKIGDTRSLETRNTDCISTSE